MNSVFYDVQALLPDGVTFWTVCTAFDQATVIAVIKSLLDCGKGSPGEIKIVIRQNC